jgi:hypothetical protein
MGKLTDMMNNEMAAINKAMTAHMHAENKQRRERIATMMLAALLGNEGYDDCQANRILNVEQATKYADALIAELDREQPHEVEP